MSQKECTPIKWCIEFVQYNIEASHLTIIINNACQLSNVCQWLQSPLHSAVRRGHVEIVRLLIDRGADLTNVSKRKYFLTLSSYFELCLV